MKHGQRFFERRQHMRVSAQGAVVLRVGGREVHGRSIVVSETALEVRCQLGFMLLSMAGASVEIEMRLDGEAGRWFLLHGQVARVRAASRSLVIAIGALPEPLAVLISEHAGRSRVAPIEVVVVGRDLARPTRRAEALGPKAAT